MKAQGTAVAAAEQTPMPSFAIGVTGHRDLIAKDRDATRRRVQTALADLLLRFQHMPVCVVSGLAEGADTLVAETALEMGIAVEAVLPMPLECYEADFDDKALEGLHRLLGDPKVTSREIPLADGVTRETITEPQNRDRQYAALMDFIHRRSNVLLALWDGKDIGLSGGTGDVVLGYLGGGEGQRPMEVPADSKDLDQGSDIVCWVPVARESNPDPSISRVNCILVANATGDCYWRQLQIPKAILDRWSGLDDFARERMSSVGTDLPVYPLLPSDAPSVSAEAKGIEAEFIRIDQLARANQARSDLMFKLFGLMAATMGLAFLVYAKLAALKVYLVIYIALFLVGFAGFSISRRNQWLAKHLSYRALAETLRVQFFLIVSGAARGYGMSRILRLTNVDHFERFDWLRDAIRCCEPLVEDHHAEEKHALTLVRSYWVEDQAKYFHKKLHLMHRRHARLEVVKTLLLAGSVLGALALIYLKKQLLHLEMVGYDGKAMLVFLMGLLPLWVAIWELYQGKMATRELIWQFSNQERLFSAAVRPIQFAKKPADAARVITDLADKALVEIYLWSVHRYHREHEPPAAG